MCCIGCHVEIAGRAGVTCELSSDSVCAMCLEGYSVDTTISWLLSKCAVPAARKRVALVDYMGL